MSSIENLPSTAIFTIRTVPYSDTKGHGCKRIRTTNRSHCALKYGKVEKTFGTRVHALWTFDFRNKREILPDIELSIGFKFEHFVLS